MIKKSLSKIYDSLEIAQYIVSECYNRCFEINNTKLNKLLYIIYGFCLAKENRVIIDEKPHLWPFGPVFPKVQVNFKNNKICGKALDELKNDESLKELIKNTVKDFGNISAAKLSAWSHREGSPWDTYVRSGEKWNSIIDDDLIKSYFKRYE